MKKTFVLDTNVLLHNYGSIESFADNIVVLPMAVIEELDKFKSNPDELGRNARQVIRRLDALRLRGKLGIGVPMDNGGLLRILTDRDITLETGLKEASADNRIIRVAYFLHTSGERVIFVSKDINARLKSDALGIETMDFEKQVVNNDELFTGWQSRTVSTSTLESLQREGKLRLPDLALMPNEFVILKAEPSGPSDLVVRAGSDGTLSRLSARSEQAWNIKPRSVEQRMALDLLLDDTVSLVTLVGQAGTGKTLLALAAGLDQTAKGKRFDKLLVSRPIMPMGKDIGFLPGDKDSKLMHWMQPIFDNLAFLMREMGDARHTIREKVDKLQRDHLVELEALTYIRGRSIPKQYVIIDEAQNLTPHEIKTIVSRAGEGTKMVLTGDPSQIDNPYLDSNSNGLSFAIEHLKASPLHGHVTLARSERSALAALATELL